AGTGERVGHAEPDAAVAAGHDCDAAREIEIAHVLQAPGFPRAIVHIGRMRCKCAHDRLGCSPCGLERNSTNCPRLEPHKGRARPQAPPTPNPSSPLASLAGRGKPSRLVSMILLQIIISGLLLGAIYALFSSGLTLIWGMMNVINFAHGEF